MKLKVGYQYTIEEKEMDMWVNVRRIEILFLTEKTIGFTDVDAQVPDIERLLLTDFQKTYKIIEGDQVEYINIVEIGE